jgi:hypothetical protein
MVFGRLIGLATSASTTGIKGRTFRSIDPNRAAVPLFGAVRKTCDQQLAKDEVWPINEMAEFVMNFFLHALRR